MKKVMTIFLLLLVHFSLFATESASTIDSARFMQWVRRTPLSASWASMQGEISHKRRGQDPLTQKIYLGSLFTAKQAYVQFVLGDSEMYTVSQAYGAGHSKSHVAPSLSANQQKLPHYGVQADDMTLSFLFWRLKNEQPTERVKLQQCRVFDLTDKDEMVRVWISIEHGFPLKAQWFKRDEKERYRSLEITSFKKQEENLWVPTEFTLEGPGWRTLIKFTDRKAGLGKENVPKDLFKN